MGWCIRWSFATAFFVAVMAGAAWFVFNQAVKGGGFVVVPEVTGLPVLQAANVLAEHGLELGKQEPVANDRVPEYHVLVQRPIAGKVIRSGRNVSLIISAGKRLETTPNLVGKEIETVLQELESTRFMSGSIARVPNEATQGTVLAQDPRSGLAASVGADIHLLVSSGPATGNQRMPNLVGMSLAGAMNALAILDVEVTTLSVDTPGSDYDVVLAQIPAPAALLYERQPVTIEARVLRAAALPNLKRKLDVSYVVPPTSFSPEIRVVIVNRKGDRQVAFPKLSDYIDGLPPRLQPGSVIEIPDVTFANEVTIQFFADNVLHQTYFYRGQDPPIIQTFNTPAAAQPAVSSIALEPIPQPTTARLDPDQEVQIEVFEPRTVRVAPTPRN